MDPAPIYLYTDAYLTGRAARDDFYRPSEPPKTSKIAGVAPKKNIRDTLRTKPVHHRSTGLFFFYYGAFLGPLTPWGQNRENKNIARRF